MQRAHGLFLAALALLAVVSGCATRPAGDASVLNVPQGLAVSKQGLREVDVSWSQPTDGSVKYVIERAAAADGTFDSVGEAPSQKGAFVDKGTETAPLADSTTYFYRLVAVNAQGAKSSPSAVTSSTTAPPPEPPSGLVAAAPKSRGVKLTWQPSTSDAVVKYRIDRTEASQPDNFTSLTEVATTEYMDGGTAASSLKDSTLYLYRVLAINRVNSSGKPCEPVEVTTMPPPDAPKALKAESRQVRCVPLTWTASPEEDVIRYDVYRGLSAKGPFEKIGDVRDRNAPKFLDGKTDPGNLEDDETYYYRVRAINDVTAESADSDVVSAETREVPPQVEDVKVEVRQPREVPITWAASKDEKVLGYEIWRAEGDGDYSHVGRVGGRDITTFVDRGGFKQFPDISQLKDGTIYNYKIIAFNTAYAKSSASTPVASETKASPATPADVTATETLPSCIRISWTANSETDIVTYVVDVSPDGRDFKRLCSIPTRTGDKTVVAREDGLSDGQKRSYRIRAIDKDRLVSPWSDPVAGGAKPIPAAPHVIHQENTDAGVRLSWDPPQQADMKAYKLYTKSTFGSDPYAVTEVPEFVVEWPSLKGSIKLMITSVDVDNRESDKSDPVTVSPPARQ